MLAKQCFKCEEMQPLAEFYRHAQMKDGHLNKCKECAKKDVRINRRESDRSRRYDRMRYQMNATRREKTAIGVKRRNREHPEKYKCRYTLTNAVRDGRIAKPDRCSSCGTDEARIEGHHADYSRPLDVEWLCSLCHRRKDFAKVA